MTGARLTLWQRLSVWGRSIVLPDMSRIVSLERLLAWYTPRGGICAPRTRSPSQ